MNHGDAILWLCLIMICLSAAVCLAVAVHRSFGKRPDANDPSEFKTFWRDRR